MIGFTKLKSAILVATLLASIGLGPVAVFADDGSGAEYTPDMNAAPTAGMSNGQTLLQNISSPLDQLVASCLPGVSSVSVQLLPEDNPSYLLVNAINADGSEAQSQTLDASFLKSCAAMAMQSGDRGAIGQAAAVVGDASSILRDFQDAPADMPQQ